MTVKEAKTNPIPGSVVPVDVETPLLFLQPETGEVIAVPKAEGPLLRSHYLKLSFLIADYHAANKAVFQCDSRMEMIAEAIAAKEMVSPNVVKEAEQVSLWALEWQEEANEALKKELKPLSKMGDSGKKLVELIPLMSKEGDKPYQVTTKRDKKLEGTTYKDSWQIKSGIGLREEFNAFRDPTNPAQPPEKLVYVESSKIKKAWPTFKDAEGTKWADVYKKQEAGPAAGKRQLDKEKLKKYVGEQVKKTKLQSKDFVKLEAEKCGTLAGEWAEAWNKTAVVGKSATLKAGSVQVADIDLGAEAALMRYLYGGSLNATFDPFKTGVSFKAEGQAEVALAEAKASAKLYLPGKDGWLWYLLDLKGKQYDLGAVRLLASIEVKGVVGASIAAELSLGVEMREAEVPAVKGRGRKRGRKRQRKVDVAAKTESVDVGGVDAGLSVFAGAKADADLKGAIQWRNPENKKKAFEDFASIAPALGGMAGIGTTAALKVEYINGIFRMTAKAGLCVGLGAQGSIGFAVGAKQLASFMKWLFYQIYNVNFTNLTIIAETAFRTAIQIQFLVIQGAMTLDDTFNKTENMLVDAVNSILKSLAEDMKGAEKRRQLAKRIINDPQSLANALPEVKGMLLYQLTRHNWADLQKTGLVIGANYLQDQKEAANIILRWSHTQADCDNVIQHMTAKGKKGDHAVNIAHLREFFAAEAPGKAHDLPLVNSPFDENFEAWYTKLKPEPTRGFEVYRSDSLLYWPGLPGDLSDHYLCTAKGDKAFYK